MESYLKLLETARKGEKNLDERTGAGTVGVHQVQGKFDLSESFPIVTTKPIHNPSFIGETLCFLRGDTNLQDFLNEGCSVWISDGLRHNLEGVVQSGMVSESEITEAQERAKKARSILLNPDLQIEERKAGFKEFMSGANKIIKSYKDCILSSDEFAEKYGQLGPIYGHQWRKWGDYQNNHLDQIKSMEEALSEGGSSRRMIASGWNFADMQDMALPPCHLLHQVHIRPESKKLDLGMYQRSCDTVLGVPFNIAAYALMANLYAHTHGYDLGELSITFADLHIYLPHLPAVEEQLGREVSAKIPRLRIKTKRSSVTEYKQDDIEVVDYEPAPRLENPTPMFGGFF